VVDARALAKEIGVPGTSIINDFDAAGHGLGQLTPADLLTVQAGEPIAHGPIALIGAGTGLGEGFLVWDADRYRVHSSEGGHADFAARDATQAALAEWLRQQYGHASYERVLSGRGIADTYRFLAGAGDSTESPAVRAEMAEPSQDPAAIITRHALARTDALCESVVALFLDVLAAQAGNVALTLAATGGVYIAGGIAPRIADLFSGGSFVEAFRAKGRMAELLSRIPVHIVLNTDVGLLGAAAVAVGRSA
jgi:glucokinase